MVASKGILVIMSVGMNLPSSNEAFLTETISVRNKGLGTYGQVQSLIRLIDSRVRSSNYQCVPCDLHQTHCSFTALFRPRHGSIEFELISFDVPLPYLFDHARSNQLFLKGL